MAALGCCSVGFCLLAASRIRLISLFSGMSTSANLILLLRHPVPCLPSSPPAPADSLHTFSLYFIAFFLPSCVGLRYSGSPPGRLAGSRSPADSTEKSCFLPLYLPAADVSSTSHCQVTLFGSIVFSNAHSGLTKHDVPTAFPRMFYTGEDTP